MTFVLFSALVLLWQKKKSHKDTETQNPTKPEVRGRRCEVRGRILPMPEALAVVEPVAELVGERSRTRVEAESKPRRRSSKVKRLK